MVKFKRLVKLLARKEWMEAGLYVIKKSSCEQYWMCSSVHGTGWNPHHPKQAFSKSELAKEVRRLVDNGLGKQRLEIIELAI